VVLRVRAESVGGEARSSTRQNNSQGREQKQPAATYSISIEDNGRGITPGRNDSLRNGLFNMRERLERIGGLFKIESGPGAGTKIHLSVPL